MKYRYELIINRGAEGKEMVFPYGSTKTARLRISYNHATLITELSKDYSESFSKSYAANLMREGIKRAALVHVLKYSKPIKISDLKVYVCEGEDRWPIKDVEGLMNFYSLINENLHLPKQLREEKVIKNILKIDKTHAGNRYASLYSYLYSCQQKNEINRFIYQWMAINGMYSFVGSKTERDNDSINNLAKQLELGDQVLPRKKRDKVGPQISELLQDVSLPVTRDSLERGEHNFLARRIDKIVNSVNSTGLNMTTYGFLIFDYAYYLRCKYFHAGMPVTLFCYKSDIEYNALLMINGLLKEFLDNYIVKLFDGTIYSDKATKTT